MLKKAFLQHLSAAARKNSAARSGVSCGMKSHLQSDRIGEKDGLLYCVKVLS